MTENGITIRHSILIAKPRELVWNYTQNYDNRTHWDTLVLESIELQPAPRRIVKLKIRGNTIISFIYQVDEPPCKTVIAAYEITSPLIVEASGSWLYEEQNGNTLWTQTNTIVFRQEFLLKFLLPVYKLFFGSLTKKAMKTAKDEIEKMY